MKTQRRYRRGSVMLLMLVLLMLAAKPVEAYYIPTDDRPTNDIQVWMVSEKNIDERWAKDNLRQLAQQYTNHGISIDPADGFLSQRGLAELRAKMSYYASVLHYKAIELKLR